MRTPQKDIYKRRSSQLKQLDKWRQSSINLIVGITFLSFICFLVFTLQFYGISQNQESAQKMLFEIKSQIVLKNLSDLNLQNNSQQDKNGSIYYHQFQPNKDSTAIELNFQYYFLEFSKKLNKCEEQKQNLLSEIIDLQSQKTLQTTGYTVENDYLLKNIAPSTNNYFYFLNIKYYFKKIDASIRKEPEYTTLPYGIQIKRFQSLLFNNEINEKYKNIEFILSDSDLKKEYFKLEGSQGYITAEFKDSQTIKAISILKLKKEEYQSCEISTFKTFGLIYNLNRLVVKNEYEKVELLPQMQLEDSDYSKIEDDLIETHYFMINEEQQAYESNGFMIEFNNSGHEEYTCVFKQYLNIKEQQIYINQFFQQNKSVYLK